MFDILIFYSFLLDHVCRNSAVFSDFNDCTYVFIGDNHASSFIVIVINTLCVKLGLNTFPVIFISCINKDSLHVHSPFSDFTHLHRIKALRRIINMIIRKHIVCIQHCHLIRFTVNGFINI